MLDAVRYCEVGVFVLFVAFVSSFLANLSIGEPVRLVVLLEANPLHSIDYIRSIFLYSILPLAVGLAFVMVDYKKERTHSTGIFHQWPLAVIGGIFSVWGVLQLSWLYNAYRQSVHIAHDLNITGIDSFIVSIYASTWVAGALWLLTGVFSLYLYLRFFTKTQKP